MTAQAAYPPLPEGFTLIDPSAGAMPPLLAGFRLIQAPATAPAEPPSMLAQIGAALHNTIKELNPKIGITFENRLAI